MILITENKVYLKGKCDVTISQISQWKWKVKPKQTQPAFACSKLAIETLEQGVKYVQKLTIKTPERHYWRRFGDIIVNFEHISRLVITLNM